MKVGIDVSKLTFDVSWLADDKSSHKCFDYTECYRQCKNDPLAPT